MPNFKFNRLSKGILRVGKKTKTTLDTKNGFYGGAETKTKQAYIFDHKLKNIVPNNMRNLGLNLRKKILEIQKSNAELRSDNHSLKKAQEKLEQLKLASLKLKRKMLQQKIAKIKKRFGHDRRFVEKSQDEIIKLEPQIKKLIHVNKK